MSSEPAVRFSRLPVDGPISGRFGQDYGGFRHRGVDFAVPEGTPVYAPAAGRSVAFTNSFTSWQGQTVRSFGEAVCINHGDGWWTLYAHLSQVLAPPGTEIAEGQIIGYSGNTGVSTGPHLHFQLCDSPAFPIDINQSRDPLAYMEEPMTKSERGLIQIGAGAYDRMNQCYAALAAAGYLDPEGGADDLNGAVVRRFRIIELAASDNADAAYKAIGGHQ